MDRVSRRGTKLVYHDKCFTLPLIPGSLETLHQAVSSALDIPWEAVHCYGVCVRGEFLLSTETDFQEFAEVCPELNCFELEDLRPRTALPLHITSLVGIKCLHQHAFSLQSFSLETFTTQSTVLKLSAGFAYVFLDSGLFITGGAEQQIRTALYFRDEVMSPHPSLLSDHCSHLSLCHGHTVYVLGGMDTRMNFSRDCEAYNYSTRLWHTLPKLNKAVQFPTGCLVNEECYVLTGQEIEVLRNGGWTSLPFEMPEGYRAATLTHIRTDTLLVFGGLGSDKAAELNLTTMKLQVVPSPPTKSKYFMNPVRKWRGKVYVWGPNLASIFAYHINLQLWTKVNADLWTLRVGLLLVYHKGRHSDALSTLWKLPLGLLRLICIQCL